MMSVIIRLQGLAWSASAADIRNFFKGLSVPPGGVHIIGGEKGDAFIAFSTDEDARRAMMLNGTLMNDTAVQLFLSSKTEMQNTILKAKEHSDAPAPLPAAPAPAVVPSASQTLAATPVPGYMAGQTAAQTLPGFNSAQQPALPTSQLNPFQSGVSVMNAILTSAGLAGMTQPMGGSAAAPKKPTVNTYEQALPGEYSVGGMPGNNQNQYPGSQIKQPQYPIDGQTGYPGLNQPTVTNSAYQVNQPYGGITVPSSKTVPAASIPSNSFTSQNPNVAPSQYGQASSGAGSYSQNEPTSVWSSGYSQQPQSQHHQRPPPNDTSQYQQPYQGTNVSEHARNMPLNAAQSTAFPRSDDRFFSGSRPPLQPTPLSDNQFSGSKPYGQPGGPPDSNFSKPPLLPQPGVDTDSQYNRNKPYGQPGGPPTTSYNKPPPNDNQYGGSKPYGQPSGPPDSNFSKPPLLQQPGMDTDSQYNRSKPYGQPGGPPDSNFSKPPLLPQPGVDTDSQYNRSKPYGQPGGPHDSNFSKPPLLPQPGVDTDSQYNRNKPYGQPSGPPTTSFNKPPPFAPAGVAHDNQYGGSKPYGQPSGTPDSNFSKPPLLQQPGVDTDSQYNRSKPYGQPGGPPDSNFSKPPVQSPGMETDSQYSGSKQYSQRSGPMDSSFSKPPPFPPVGMASDNQFSGNKPYGQPSGPTGSNFSKPPLFPVVGVPSDNQYSGRKPYGHPSESLDGSYNKPPPFPLAGESTFSGQKFDKSLPPDKRFDDNQPDGQTRPGGDSGFIGQRFDQPPYRDNRFDARRPGVQNKPDGDSNFTGQRFDSAPPMDNRYEGNWHDRQNKPFRAAERFPRSGYNATDDREQFGQGKRNYSNADDKGKDGYEPFPEYPNPYQSDDDMPAYNMNRMPGQVLDKFQPPAKNAWSEPHHYPTSKSDASYGADYNQQPNYQTDFIQPEPMDLDPTVETDIVEQGTPGLLDETPNNQSDQPEIKEPAKPTSEVKSSSSGNDKSGRISKERSRDNDRSRRDSPVRRDRFGRDMPPREQRRDREEQRDRDKRDRNKDDDRKSRRDRDRDRDRDRGRDRHKSDKRSRDRDDDKKDRGRGSDKKNSSIDDNRKSRKRSLSPNSQKNNTDEKKLQVEKGEAKPQQGNALAQPPKPQQGNALAPPPKPQQGNALAQPPKPQQGNTLAQPPKIMDIRDLNIVPPKGFVSTFSDTANESLPDIKLPTTSVNPPPGIIQPLLTASAPFGKGLLGEPPITASAPFGKGLLGEPPITIEPPAPFGKGILGEPPITASAPISKGLLGDAPPGLLPFNLNARPGAEGQTDRNSGVKTERREGRASRFSDRRDDSPHAGNKDKNDQRSLGEDVMWPGYYEPPYEEDRNRPHQPEHFDNRGPPGLGRPNSPNRPNYRGPPQGDMSNRGPEGMRPNRDEFREGPGDRRHPPHPEGMRPNRDEFREGPGDRRPPPHPEGFRPNRDEFREGPGDRRHPPHAEGMRPNRDEFREGPGDRHHPPHPEGMRPNRDEFREGPGPNRDEFREGPGDRHFPPHPEGMRPNRDEFREGPGDRQHPPHPFEDRYHEGPPDEFRGYPGDFHGPPNPGPGLMGPAPMDDRRNFRGPPPGPPGPGGPPPGPPGPGFDGPRGRFPHPMHPDMHGPPVGPWRDDRRHPRDNVDFRGPAPPRDFNHPDSHGPPRGDRRGPFDRPYGGRPHEEDRRSRESPDSRESFRGERDWDNNERSDFRGRRGPPFEMRGAHDRNSDRPPREGSHDRHFERPPRDNRENYGRMDSRDQSQSARGPPPNQPGANRIEGDRAGSTGRQNNTNNDRPNSSIQQNQSKDTENAPHSTSDPNKGIALCSVVIERMTQQTSYKDIKKMFTGLDIPKDGIKLINDSKGKRIGKAFVRFGNQESFKKGLQFDRTKLNSSLIIIKPVSRKEYDNAVDSYIPGEPEDAKSREKNIEMCHTLTATIRQLKGEPDIKSGGKVAAQTEKTFIAKITRLPSTTTVDELKDFFSSCEIPNRKNAIVVEYDNARKCTGLAFVEFTNDKHFQAAFKLRRVFDKNVISLVEGTKKEVDELIQKMKNVLGRDLYAVESTPAKVEMTKAAVSKAEMTKATGSKAEVTKAVVSNNKSSQKPSAPKQKPNDATPSSRRSTRSSSASSAETDQSQKSSSFSTRFIRIENAPFDLKPQGILFLFGGLPVAHRGIQICHDGIGRPVGEVYVEFMEESSVEKALKKNGEYLGKCKLSISPISKENVIQNCRILRQSLQPETPSREAVFYFVKASNLPKGVTTGEIMNFFSGYFPAPESIRLNIGDPSQEPPDTSTALIGFPGKDEAERALKTVHGNHLRDKVIKLTKVII